MPKGRFVVSLLLIVALSAVLLSPALLLKSLPLSLKGHKAQDYLIRL
jgi:hypothetical protein